MDSNIKSCTKYIVICSDGNISYAYDTNEQKAEDVVLNTVGKAFTTSESFVVIAKTEKSKAKILHYLELAYAKIPNWLSKNVLCICNDTSACMKFKKSDFIEVVQNEIAVVSFH